MSKLPTANVFNLSKATLIIGVGTILTKLISLVKVNLLASTFAASDIADIYFSAFRLPDIIFNFLILGTLSVSFIPLYAGLKVESSKTAQIFASRVFNLVLLAMLIVCGLAWVLAEPLTHAIVPGFEGEKFSQTLYLTRYLLLSPLIFSLSHCVSSLLSAHKRFWLMSLSPFFYNLGIILGIQFLFPRFGIAGLAYGVILGAFLHFLIQIPDLIKIKFHWFLSLSVRNIHVKKWLKLFLPRLLAFDSAYINLTIGSIIGSNLASGSIAVYNYGFDLQSVPLGIFAYSVASAAFPALADFYVRGQEAQFMTTLKEGMEKILFYLIPISLAFLIFRAQIVRILLGHGSFGWEETILTFQVLGIFSLSLAAQALIPLLARAFYSRQNTYTPVVVGGFSLLLNTVLAINLYPDRGILGIAIAFTFSSLLQCLILYLLLRFRFLALTVPKSEITKFDLAIFSSLFKIGLSAGIFGVTAYGALYMCAWFLNTTLTLGLIFQVGLSATLGALAYLTVAVIFNLSEAKKILKPLIKKIHRL